MEPAQTVTARPAAPLATAGFTATDLTLLFVVTIWGVNFVVAKAALAQLAPLAFNGLRFTLAPLLLIAFYALRGGNFRVTRRDALALIGLGLIGTTGYQLFFIHGLARTTAALIQAALPVIVAAESHLLRIERLRPVAWIGVALSLVGICLVIRGRAHGFAFDRDSITGDLLIVGSVFCWATYTVLSKPLVSRLDPVKVTTLAMAGGAVPLLAVASPALMAQAWGSVTWPVWVGVAYSGIFAIGTAYVLWVSGVQKVGGPRTAVYSNLVPVVVVLTAFVFLGETISWLQAAGAVVIFAGIALTRIKR